jgi:hypothetical protein
MKWRCVSYENDKDMTQCGVLDASQASHEHLAEHRTTICSVLDFSLSDTCGGRRTRGNPRHGFSVGRYLIILLGNRPFTLAVSLLWSV